MIRTLQDRGVQQGIDVYMEYTVTRLLTDNGRVCRRVCLWRENGRFIVFKAKSIVVATGGIGKAWRVTSNSWEYTGDGMALAHEALADLADDGMPLHGARFGTRESLVRGWPYPITVGLELPTIIVMSSAPAS